MEGPYNHHIVEVKEDGEEVDVNLHPLPKDLYDVTPVVDPFAAPGTQNYHGSGKDYWVNTKNPLPPVDPT